MLGVRGRLGRLEGAILAAVYAAYLAAAILISS